MLLWISGAGRAAVYYTFTQSLQTRLITMVAAFFLLRSVLQRLDIAGQSIYCERTGGDYHDYLGMGDCHEGRIGIVVGDVSGHGIPSALLMTSARSSIRQRASRSGSIAQIVSDVNRQLTRDVEESGRFMTLFCSQIDTRSRSISWVRAGHDPAILYDPVTDSFEKLK